MQIIVLINEDSEKVSSHAKEYLYLIVITDNLNTVISTAYFEI